MAHYTEKFKKAYDKVLEIIKEKGELEGKRAFRNMMLELGHEERIANLYRIQDKLTKKAIFFNPNRPQATYLKRKGKRNIILKCRQVGFTTLNCIRALDLALWEANTRTGIMCHKLTLVKTIFNDITKFSYNWFLRDWGHLYRPKEKADSSTALSFIHDGLGRPLESSILVLHDFRGKTVHFLHVSESARIEEDRLTGSINGVPDNGEVTHESTAFGMEGEFYRLWQEWKTDRRSAPCKGDFIPWYAHYPENPDEWDPEGNEEWSSYELHLLKNYNNKITPNHLLWRRWCVKAKCGGSKDRFENEYPTNDQDCFRVNEASVFEHSLIKFQSKHVKESIFRGFLLMNNKTIQLHDDDHGYIDIWEEPNPSHTYVIGADPSGGVGRDNAAAFVKCQQTGKHVARIWGQVGPADFGKELYKLGTLFNKAYICVETNNHGHLVVHVLKESGYMNLYKRQTIDEITKKPTKKLGFVTNNESKIMITEKFKTSCREGKTIIQDIDLIKEMTSFVQIASKTNRTCRREAVANAHDDLVIAASLADEMDSTRPMGITEEETFSIGHYTYDDETGFIIGDRDVN